MSSHCTFLARNVLLYQEVVVWSIYFSFVWDLSIFICCVKPEVVISPPYVFLPQVQSTLRSDFAIAAQNAWVKKGGAYTGEIRWLDIFFIWCWEDDAF